jgi:hypothetical protein
MNATTEQDWRFWLFELVDDYRQTKDDKLLASTPAALSARLRALLAAVVETLATEAGRATPEWCRQVGPLPEPWFVAEVENLKATALVESPLPFRRRNIFVLENFLSRL